MKYVVNAVLMVAVVAVDGVDVAARERAREVDDCRLFGRSKPRSGSALKRLLSRRVWRRFESSRAAAPDLVRLT